MKKNSLDFAYKHLGVLLLFILFLVAFVTFDEYGMSWDEPIQRKTGEISYNYVFSDDESLLTWKDKDYGVAFELPLIILEKGFNLTGEREIFIMRHLVTHSFFLIGAYFLFLLIDYLYKNKLLATIGFFLLILHPRIYAHSFFNTKDIPFLSMFIICFYYYVKAFDKKSVLSFIKLGVCVGLLINLRIMGVLILLGTLLILLLDIVRAKERQREVRLMIVFLVSSCLALYVTWPFLWKDPLGNLVLAFDNMSKFRWGGTVLFDGELIRATKLSWKYIPTWFSITTPIVYILLGVIGFLMLIFKLFKSPFSFLENSIKRTNLLFLGYFLAPILAVVVFHSVLYDGWRQMFFIYPPFILLGIYSLSSLITKNKQKQVIMLLPVIITFIFTGGYMIINFPVQGAYFNEALSFNSPEHLRKRFEMDYWGVSYKQTLEYLLEVDSSASINVAVANHPGKNNVEMLPIKERNRIKIVPKEQATYFITNYRWHPQDYSEYTDFKFYSLMVGNNTINEIFKLR